MGPKPGLARPAHGVPVVLGEVMPFVENKLNVRESAFRDKFLRARRLAHGLFGVNAVPVPTEEVWRDSCLLARRQEFARKRFVEPRQRGAAYLQFRELALEPLQTRNEKIDELVARSAPARRNIRLIEKLPVFDVPVEAVCPAPRVVAHNPREGFGVFYVILRIQGVGGVLVARVLYGRAETVEHLHLARLLHGRKEIVGRLEEVVLRVFRIEVQKREDEMCVDDPLPASDKRRVV